MPGHYIVALQLQSTAEKPVEFQIPVAVDAGIGSSAAFVAADKFLDDLPLKIVLEVEHVVGNPQTSGHAAGILHVVQTTAGVPLFQTDHIIVVQPHGRADALVACAKHQQRRHGAVHAAGHADQRLLAVHEIPPGDVFLSISAEKENVNGENPTGRKKE